MPRLAGKVALISGAARGQGEAEARLFAREGASVVLGDVRAEQGEQVARAIAADGGKAVFTPLDVSNEGDWARAVELAERELGRLDILVNNAAILGRPGIMETFARALGRGRRRQPDRPVPRHARGDPGDAARRRRIDRQHLLGARDRRVRRVRSYTAAKGALTALTRTVAVELAPEGIRVNVVHPGVIDTPMVDDGVGRRPRRCGPRPRPRRSAASAGPRRWPRRCCSSRATSRRS